MPFLIDTNIAVHARDGFEPVLQRFERHAGQMFLSALSLAELQRGLISAIDDGPKRRARLRVILSAIPVLPFDQTAAEVYGELLMLLGWSRRRDFDRMIAAHALAVDCSLVTANVEDFADVPNLRIEDWSK